MRAALFVLFCGLSFSVIAETTVFEHVNVVRIGSGEVLADRFVQVDDGRITAITDQAPAVEGRRIDGKGLYLAPGLTEMHAHLPPVAQAQNLQDVLFLYLSQGITTVRSMLGEPGHLALREQAEQGAIDSPHIIASAPSLNGNSVESPEAAVAMVRAAHEAGYDHLKLHPGLTREEFDAIARTANELDMKFVGHVDDSYGARHAMAAGMTGIDHLDGFLAALVPGDERPPQGFFGLQVADQVDPDLIPVFVDEVAQSGTWVVPTETLMVSLTGPTGIDELLDRPENRYASEQTKAQWRQARAQVSAAPADLRESFLELRRKLIHALHEAGANIALGSDAPQVFNVPGFSIHRELELYVDAGLSPREALATGTVNTARYQGRDDLGEVAEGHVADLVLLGCNPLESIDCTRQVHGVMVGGRWFDEESISRGLDQIAERAK